MENKENKKAGKFLKKRKKTFPILLVFLLILALGAGIWWFLNKDGLLPVETTPGEITAPTETGIPSGSSAPETEDFTVPEETTTPTRPSGEYEMPQAYLDVLDRYKRAVDEKWDFMQCEENQISYMIILNYDLQGLGYHTPDLDNDGVRELIVTNGVVIFDLYTLVDEELVWVVSGGERNTYQLCQNGFLANRGSNGASSYVENFYYLKGGELVLKEGILVDAMSETSKWTLTGEGIDSPEAISAERYQEIVASYQTVRIPVVLISEAS